MQHGKQKRTLIFNKKMKTTNTEPASFVEVKKKPNKKNRNQCVIHVTSDTVAQCRQWAVKSSRTCTPAKKDLMLNKEERDINRG